MDAVASLQLFKKSSLFVTNCGIGARWLKLPLVLWADSLILDLICHCTKIHWMYNYHPASRNMGREKQALGSSVIASSEKEGSG